MSNQPNATPAQSDTTPLKRVFKVGANRIAEDAATAKLTNEQIRKLLTAQYPEVANATIRETVSGDTRVIDFIAVAGRKG